MFKTVTTLFASLLLAGCTPRSESSPREEKEDPNTQKHVAVEKEKRERAPANLSLESGPSDAYAAETTIFLVISYDEGTTRAQAGVFGGEIKAQDLKWLSLGTLDEQIADRSNGAKAYARMHDALLKELRHSLQRSPSAKCVGVVVDSSSETPWGFITLALDTAASFNVEIESGKIEGRNEALAIVVSEEDLGSFDTD